jgi:hypothetical protein
VSFYHDYSLCWCVSWLSELSIDSTTGSAGAFPSSSLEARERTDPVSSHPTRFTSTKYRCNAFHPSIYSISVLSSPLCNSRLRPCRNHLDRLDFSPPSFTFPLSLRCRPSDSLPFCHTYITATNSHHGYPREESVVFSLSFCLFALSSGADPVDARSTVKDIELEMSRTQKNKVRLECLVR